MAERLTNGQRAAALGISRQALWQRERKAEGLCCICAKPALTGGHCAECREKKSKRQNRQVSKGIYRSKYNNRGGDTNAK